MHALQHAARRAKGFLLRLHRDESGPGTVEWLLLVVVALVVMIGIYAVVQWIGQETSNAANDMVKNRKKSSE